MKKNSFTYKLAVWMLIVLSGCTIYERDVPIIKVPEFYEFRADTGPLIIITDPYGRKGKIVNIFGLDLREHDILPMHLIIENHGQNEYDLSSLKVSLASKQTGEEYPLVDARQIAHEAKYNTAGRMIVFGLAGSAPFFLLTIPFAVSAGLSTADANRRMEQDFNNQMPIETLIRPREMVNGFLFFRVPAHGKSGELIVDQSFVANVSGIVNQATHEKVQVQIPIQSNSDWLRE